MQEKNLILCIEDDAIDAMTVKRAFKDLEIDKELKIVHDGSEALLFLRDDKNPKPCFILLDLNMPVMNGFEFLAEIKQDILLKKYPIIVLTSSDKEKDREYCFDLNAAGYFVKPPVYAKFINIIKIINDYWNAGELPISSS